MTYDEAIASFGETASLTVQLWFYTDSEAVPNAKADELFKRLSDGGVQLECDSGSIWLTRGNPFSISDIGSSKNEKLRQINIEAQFNTID